MAAKRAIFRDEIVRIVSVPQPLECLRSRRRTTRSCKRASRQWLEAVRSCQLSGGRHDVYVCNGERMTCTCVTASG
jgi:hypothetical protein